MEVGLRESRVDRTGVYIVGWLVWNDIWGGRRELRKEQSVRSARMLVILLTTGMVLSVGVPSASADDIEGAVLVVDDTNSYAYVGWHGSFEFPSTLGQPWSIFLDVVSWATSGGIPADTEILLFTADGTPNPDHVGNLDAGTFYNRLVAEGYDPAVADQTDIATMTDFSALALAARMRGGRLRFSGRVGHGIPLASFSFNPGSA